VALGGSIISGMPHWPSGITLQNVDKLGTASSSFGAVSFNYNVNGKHRTHCRCVIAVPLPFQQQIVE